MILETRHISKRFASLNALSDVSLTLRPGRVHGVLGENGAGKTTLMNILYGLLRADAGEILIDDRPTVIRSPQDALKHGIGMIHQHFMLAGAMTVLDNVLLGDSRAGQWLDRRAATKKLTELSQHIGLPVPLSARVNDLSVGQQQRVEILKALYREARLLILDEPTAVLTPTEVQELFTALDTLKIAGHGIVFISHKLGEIRQICDDITVLRGGRVVFNGEAKSVTADELSHHMVGRHVTPARRSPVEVHAAREVVARVTSLSLTGLRDVSFDIHAGEILGVAGVDGNGQQELAEGIVGLRTLDHGRIEIEGRDVTGLRAADRFRLGLAHIPNDRKREGLVGSMSIAENLSLKSHSRRPFSRAGLLFRRTARKTAHAMIERFAIRASSVDTPVSTLSGGNAQKVILARELALGKPRLVIAMNPVRGLDVAATQFVYQELLAIRKTGAAILLISSELDELLNLCDRIAVLYTGRFQMSDFPRDGADVIGRLMTGAAS